MSSSGCNFQLLGFTAGVIVLEMTNEVLLNGCNINVKHFSRENFLKYFFNLYISS